MPINQTRLAVTGFWLACVVAGSFLPLDWKSVLHTHGGLHLPLHFVVFAGTGWMVVSLSRSLWRRALFCAALMALAFALEAMQKAIYPIHFEWADLATDTAGILAALLGSHRSAS